MQADYKKIRKKLNIAMGQLEGVSRMVDKDRYCIDISIQLMAVTSALKSINKDILQAHLNGCVSNAIETGNKENIDEKLGEIVKIISGLQ